MQRLYSDLLKRQLSSHRQMAFLMGPRQVGKTTIAQEMAASWENGKYWTWDNPSHRSAILQGPEELIQASGLQTLGEKPCLLVIDELHKYSGWKDYLKGLFDTYEPDLKILVTGSARLDVFRCGGDSLMGRYFPWRMHPLSPGELMHPQLPADLLRPLNKPMSKPMLKRLMSFGGFPVQEDLRDLTQLRDLSRLAHLGERFRHRAGQLSSYSKLASEVKTTVPTVQKWVTALEAFYFSFAVRPYSRNIPRALRKEPKHYLWDWSMVPDLGQRAENLIAAALMKSVQIWTDLGLGMNAVKADPFKVTTPVVVPARTFLPMLL